MALRSAGVAFQKLYALNPLAATARMRSARGIGGLPRPVLNMISMLTEMVYGGGVPGDAALAVPRLRASRPSGPVMPARRTSRRWVIAPDYMRASIFRLRRKPPGENAS